MYRKTLMVNMRNILKHLDKHSTSLIIWLWKIVCGKNFQLLPEVISADHSPLMELMREHKMKEIYNYN